MEARYDAKLYSRYKPLPLKENVAPNVAVAIKERIEDFPGVEITETWKRVYPYAPLASHVLGYMGAITAEDEQHYQDLGYDTSSTARRSAARASSSRWRPCCTASGARSTYEVDANNRIVRQLSYEAPVNGQDIQLSIDLSLQQYAERLLQTQLALKRLFMAQNPEVAQPRRRPADRSTRTCAVGAEVHYPAPAGSIGRR